MSYYDPVTYDALFGDELSNGPVPAAAPERAGLTA